METDKERGRQARRGRYSIRGNKVQEDNDGDMKWKAEKESVFEEREKNST